MSSFFQSPHLVISIEMVKVASSQATFTISIEITPLDVQNSQFLKSAWRHSGNYYYDKARNTPYFAFMTFGGQSRCLSDLNADIRGGFTNLTADYQKLRLEIGVGI